MRFLCGLGGGFGWMERLGIEGGLKMELGRFGGGVGDMMSIVDSLGNSMQCGSADGGRRLTAGLAN